MNIGYIRISRSEETIQNQEYAIEKFAGEELKFFHDIVSGKSNAETREGYERMMEYIEQKHPEKLFVYELSRLGRDFYDVLKTINHLESEKNVLIFSTSSNEIFMNAMDPSIRKIVRAFIAWAHEREREGAMQRTKTALERIKNELNTKGEYKTRSGKIIRQLGRPERDLDWKQIDDYKNKGMSYSNICKLMDINYVWFLRKKKEMKIP